MDKNKFNKNSVSSLLVGNLNNKDNKQLGSKVLLGRKNNSASSLLVGRLKDTDKDGYPNIMDCNPLNPNEHGIFKKAVNAVKSVVSKVTGGSSSSSSSSSGTSSSSSSSGTSSSSSKSSSSSSSGGSSSGGGSSGVINLNQQLQQAQDINQNFLSGGGSSGGGSSGSTSSSSSSSSSGGSSNNQSQINYATGQVNTTEFSGGTSKNISYKGDNNSTSPKTTSSGGLIPTTQTTGVYNPYTQTYTTLYGQQSMAQSDVPKYTPYIDASGNLNRGSTNYDKFGRPTNYYQSVQEEMKTRQIQAEYEKEFNKEINSRVAEYQKLVDNGQISIDEANNAIKKDAQELNTRLQDVYGKKLTQEYSTIQEKYNQLREEIPKTKYEKRTEFKRGVKSSTIGFVGSVGKGLIKAPIYLVDTGAEVGAKIVAGKDYRYGENTVSKTFNKGKFGKWLNYDYTKAPYKDPDYQTATITTAALLLGASGKVGAKVADIGFEGLVGYQGVKFLANPTYEGAGELTGLAIGYGAAKGIGKAINEISSIKANTEIALQKQISKGLESLSNEKITGVNWVKVEGQEGTFILKGKQGTGNFIREFEVKGKFVAGEDGYSFVPESSGQSLIVGEAGKGNIYLRPSTFDITGAGVTRDVGELKGVMGSRTSGFGTFTETKSTEAIIRTRNGKINIPKTREELIKNLKLREETVVTDFISPSFSKESGALQIVYQPSKSSEVLSFIKKGVREKPKVEFKLEEKPIEENIPEYKSPLNTNIKENKISGQINKILEKQKVDKQISSQITKQLEEGFAKTTKREYSPMLKERLMERANKLSNLIVKPSSAALISQVKFSRGKSDVSGIFGIKTKQAETNISIQKPSNIQGITPVSISGTSYVTETITPTITKPINPITVIPAIPRPIEPQIPKPIEPEPIFPIEIRKEKPEFKNVQGYDVKVLREATKSGKRNYEQINKVPLTLNSARSMGTREVDNSISARYVIEKSKPIIKKVDGKNVKETPKAFDTKDKYFEMNKFKFRDYKVRKGNKVPLTTGTYIEKSAYRADSPQEVRTLQTGKQQRKGFFGF